MYLEIHLDINNADFDAPTVELAQILSTVVDALKNADKNANISHHCKLHDSNNNIVGELLLHTDSPGKKPCASPQRSH